MFWSGTHTNPGKIDEQETIVASLLQLIPVDLTDDVPPITEMNDEQPLRDG
jgi:hypothetical protein